MQYIDSAISLTLKVLQTIWISVFQCTDTSHKDVNAIAFISNSGVKENVDTKTDVVLFKFSLLVLYVLAGILGSCLKLLVISYGIFLFCFEINSVCSGYGSHVELPCSIFVSSLENPTDG